MILLGILVLLGSGGLWVVMWFFTFAVGWLVYIVYRFLFLTKNDIDTNTLEKPVIG